jgi:ABC-type lipoprotein release transport system permease subunit
MLALAWRNLWRQRGRGLATLLAVAAVAALILIVLGVKGGLMNASFQDVTRLGGHLQVLVPDHLALQGFEAGLVRDLGGIASAVADADPSAVAVPVLDVPALAAGEARSRGIRVTGVSHPPPLRTTFATEYLADGRLPEAGDLETIALGAALAQSLQVGLGDSVLLYAPGTAGIGAAAYTVVGLLEHPDPVLEGRTAYLSLEAAQELAAPGRATRVEVYLPGVVRLVDDHRADAVRDALEARLGDVRVETWREVEPSKAGLIAALDQLLYATAVLFFVLAGLMVVNTCYLSLIERIREFGTIISLGATPGTVMRMILTESLLLCAGGALAGAAVGLAAVGAMARGVQFPEALGALDTFGLPQTFYASLSTAEGLLTVLLTIAIGVLASLWPAVLAARLAPVEAMRFAP